MFYLQDKVFFEIVEVTLQALCHSNYSTI
jgi:hypothetical protein